MRNEEMTKEVPDAIRFSSIQPNAQNDLTFLDALLIISQRKKLVGILTAACTAIALVVAFTLPQEYTATVVILPPQANSTISSKVAGQVASTNTAKGGVAGSVPVTRNINDMYVSRLKSRSVEDAVIQRYGLQSEYQKTYLSDTRTELEKHATIDGSTKDGLIRLNFEDRNPNRAAEIANGYVDQFRNLSQHLAMTEAAQLEKTKKDLEDAAEAREAAFIQIVDAAVPPEKKSFPKRGMLTITGLSVGLSLGIMLALLQGGLVRMRQNPATKDKLDLLKCSLWVGHTVKPKAVNEEDGALQHARPEATG